MSQVLHTDKATINAVHAGAKVKFQPSRKFLKGSYRLNPTPVWDSALRFTKNMYQEGQYMCLSFTGPKKILKLGKGGAILTDDKDACNWFKRARYHGRRPVDHLTDNFDMIGWNMYMPPEQAAEGLELFKNISDDNDDLETSGMHKDLSEFPIYEKANR